MSKLTKEQVLHQCRATVEDRTKALQAELEKVKASAQEETKSSMGDKYETGREMMMQESNKLNERLEVLLRQTAALSAIDGEAHAVVKSGSLVQTDQGIYFISVALGVLEIKKVKVFVVSPVAPLVRELIGKAEGDVIQFNGRKQRILSVS